MDKELTEDQLIELQKQKAASKRKERKALEEPVNPDHEIDECQTKPTELYPKNLPKKPVINSPDWIRKNKEIMEKVNNRMLEEEIREKEKEKNNKSVL